MQKNNYLIVGGTSGIGLEIVKTLSDRGHVVTVVSRGSHTPIEGSGIHHIPMDTAVLPIDAGDWPDTLQGLVYCPGSIRLKPFQRLKPEDFLEDYHVNVMGAVNVIQAALSRLKKSRTGAAIVLFSTVAVQTGMPFHASIASAKGAVEGLTRSLAAELAPRIRVNAVAPSLTDTPLAKNLLGSEDKRKASAERHPLKRIGSPEEMAQMVSLLLSESGSWITGQIFHVDGGMSSLRTFK